MQPHIHFQICLHNLCYVMLLSVTAVKYLHCNYGRTQMHRKIHFQSLLRTILLCQWRKLLKALVISTSQPSLISHCKNANCPVTLKTMQYPHFYKRRLYYLKPFLYIYQYIQSCLPTSVEPLLLRHCTFALKAPWLLSASPLCMAPISPLWAHLKSGLMRGLFSGYVQDILLPE